MTTENVPTRRLPYWIDRFVEWTDGIASPEIFRRWGAINALAGLLERRIWLETDQGPIYPNLYTMLVGLPGVGKSETIKRVDRLWRSMRDLPGGKKLHVAPHNVTRASLIKEMMKASTRLVRSETELLEYHSLVVCSSEFSSFLPQYDNDFLSALTQLYDCEDQYEETRIEQERMVPNPQLHILGGTTPGFIASTFPDLAWSHGFSARMIFIFSQEPSEITLFGGKLESKDSLWKDLVHDAKIITQLYGQLEWLPDAKEVIEAWHATGCAPVPDHPKLTTYRIRRLLQVLKLTISASVSRGNDLCIRGEDVTNGIAWLLHAEQFMPNLFTGMSAASGTDVLAELHHWAITRQLNGQGGLHEGQVVRWLMHRVRQYEIVHYIENMTRSGLFDKDGTMYIARKAGG